MDMVNCNERSKSIQRCRPQEGCYVIFIAQTIACNNWNPGLWQHRSWKNGTNLPCTGMLITQVVSRTPLTIVHFNWRTRNARYISLLDIIDCASQFLPLKILIFFTLKKPFISYITTFTLHSLSLYTKQDREKLKDAFSANDQTYNEFWNARRGWNLCKWLYKNQWQWHETR